MIQNDHHVPKKQWNKWNETSRFVFNELYEHMTIRPDLFQARTTTPMKVPTPEWKITAFNAAFIAADAVRMHERMDMAA